MKTTPSRTGQNDELLSAHEQLEELGIAIGAILESLGQALLYFGRDGVCAPVFSKACLPLLESDPAGRHIADVLRLSGNDKENLAPLLGMLFDDDSTAMPFSELVALLPQWYRHSKGLQIALSYKPMRNPPGEVTGILLVATDITLKVETREKLRQKEEQVLRTLRIAGNRGGFVRYLRSFEATFKTIGSAESLGDILRDLHTLKAMAKVFYLSNVAGLLHEVEDRVERLHADNWRAEFAEVMADFQVRLELMLEYERWLGREIWGYEFENGKDITYVGTAELYQFGQDLRRMLAVGTAPEKVVESYFQHIASVPIREMLTFFETQVSFFAEATDRQVRLRHGDMDEVRIFPEFYGPFFDSLTHVARNILDHAYEPPAMREILGKLPELYVTIGVVYADEKKDSFVITIADDGAGVAPAEVRERLKAKGIDADAEDDDEVIQHIFDAHFSTKDHINVDSGRGVGMNVVKAEVKKLGGSIRVESRHGFSTKLTIRLPVVWSKPQDGGA